VKLESHTGRLKVGGSLNYGNWIAKNKLPSVWIKSRS